jgi:hypothetical protein
MQNIDHRWQIPIIQGYVGYAECPVMGETAHMFVISRRRHLNSGTRYNARGMDDDGNVANYVESE